VQSGDWLTPHYNYEPRFQKPVLFYWLVSATYVAAGIGEAQARLWSALAGVGLALLTAAAGRRWRDGPTGVLAGAMVATSFGYFSIGRLALPDLPLAFFVTLTIFAALVGTLDDPARTHRWLVLSGVGAGCGFLTKGPVGLLIPALVLLPIWWLERRRAVVRPSALALATLVAAVVGVPWYVAMWLTHGRAYLDSFFVGDNLERFATSRFNDPRPVWFYVPILLGGMLPWTPLLAAGVPPSFSALRRRAAPGPIVRRLLVWTILPLLFFTASIGKQPRYILPVLPPLALLLSIALQRQLSARGDRRDALLQVPAAIVAVLLGALAVLIYRARALVVMVSPIFITAAVAAIAGAALVALAAAVGPRARIVPVAIVLSGALLLGGLQYGLSPAGRDPVQDMAALVLRERHRDEPIATFRVFVRNLVFYTGIRQADLLSDQHVLDYLRTPTPVFCVIDADELARIGRAQGLRLRVLGEVLYFNASAVKLRTLLDPDEDRDLARVLLVTNQ
jgi:4-amino-4-deoxy-L-arabinose transferase-like glycosyltransferase